jgi:hypothetical protein
MENKTGKYFKYAIGEIVLVVIGILIALQINNWNEHRKEKMNEKDLYSHLILDLQVDEKKIDNYITFYKDNQILHNRIYQETQGVTSNDSLNDFSVLRAARIFDLLIEANYSNYIKEISNNDVRENLNNYFMYEKFVHDAFTHLQEFKEDRLKPFLSKYGMNDTKELFNHYQLDYYELREKSVFSYAKLKEQYGNIELDQMLFNLGIKTSWALTALEDLLDKNQKLQLDLKNKLDD